MTSVSSHNYSMIESQSSNTNNNQYGLLLNEHRIPKWKKDHINFINNLRGGAKGDANQSLVNESLYDDYLKC